MPGGVNSSVQRKQKETPEAIVTNISMFSACSLLAVSSSPTCPASGHYATKLQEPL